MTQKEIIEALRRKIDFTKEEIDIFFDKIEHQSYAKNAYLTKPGDLNPPFMLIKSGCLMTYFKDLNDHIHAIQFGQEMWWTGDLDAFFNGKPSKYGIKALTDVEVYLFKREIFELINNSSTLFERYFRQLFQNALISHQNRIIRNISFTAEEKYLEFIRLHPRLELIVPQKYIASYMGITPEFLSKLKKQIAKS
ncbi:cAMP-binding protein [Marivirga lumbricoides]|uniref:cAMP-binding protein n=2 Tax=Marivirga lumbricoides TaxID=1046115 RepID=A0ABQ1MWM8_9BACT|nr:cAMP-binding protein [Marivirga lumbricoides]